MTNNEILALANGLKNIDPPNMVADFNYAISENLQRASHLAINIQEAIKDSKEVAEFNSLLKVLQENHAVKDKEGMPERRVIPLANGGQMVQYNIPDAKDPESEFSIKLEELREKYRKDIKAQEKRLLTLNKENKDFEPYWIIKSDIPDGLSRDEMDLIKPLVKVN